MKWKFWQKKQLPDEGWLYFKVCVSCGNKGLVNDRHICVKCNK